MKRLMLCALFVFSLNAKSVERTPTEIVYSSSEETKMGSTFAEMWDLTRADVKKYNLLIKGPRGVYSPDIAPPLALALEETNITEKKRYLTIYAKQEHDRTQKDLDTSRMYDKIFNELFPEPVINNDILFKGKEDYIKAGDRFVIFIDNECSNCKGKLLQGLMKSSVFPNNPTDIFVKGMSDQYELHQWASDNSIKIDDVRNGDVTLNLIAPETEHLVGKSSYAIYVLRNDSLFSFTN